MRNKRTKWASSPRKRGSIFDPAHRQISNWIPAFAGMTSNWLGLSAEVSRR
jgi:hypothetical protein